MKEIFDYFDKDSDNLIELKDIDKVCQVIGLGFNLEKSKKLLSEINPKFAEKMDFETFKQIMEKKVFPEMTQEDLYNSFKVFDKNNTGRINTFEFKQIMTQVAKENNTLSSKEIDDFMKLADSKGDGFFDYDHFVRKLN